jgi:hypothetical protein
LALLVFAALLLRALIPAGFMPLAGPGGPHLGFCPAAGALPPGSGDSATPASHLVHLHHGAGRGTPEAPHHPACVFSAGAATVFAAVPTLAPVLPTLRAHRERRVSRIVLPTILRAQSSRGPPILA